MYARITVFLFEKQGRAEALQFAVGEDCNAVA